MKMLVKKIEIEFSSDDMTESEIEKKMTLIENKFSERATDYEIGFRTKLKSYAGKGNEDSHNKIKFEFDEQYGIHMSDAIRIFDGWQRIFKIDFKVYLKEMVIKLL